MCLAAIRAGPVSISEATKVRPSISLASSICDTSPEPLCVFQVLLYVCSCFHVCMLLHAFRAQRTASSSPSTIRDPRVTLRSSRLAPSAFTYWHLEPVIKGFCDFTSMSSADPPISVSTSLFRGWKGEGSEQVCILPLLGIGSSALNYPSPPNREALCPNAEGPCLQLVFD